MSKGLSLEDFKKQLDSDAQQTVITQKGQIEELEKKIERQQRKIYQQNEEAYYLFKRCSALTSNTMCQYCGISQRCHDVCSIFDAKLKGKHAETSVIDDCHLMDNPGARLEMYAALGGLLKSQEKQCL